MVQGFVAGRGWTRGEFDFANLGVEPWDLISVFVGSTMPGKLELSSDALRFE